MAAIASPAAASRYGARGNSARRVATLAAVIAVHVLVAILLLARSDVSTERLTGDPLTIFDVPPPPPPVVSEPEPSVAAARPAANPGGSSGRTGRDSAPAPAGAAATPDTTVVPIALPAPPPRIGIGTAGDLAGLGSAGVTGAFDGSGAGRGTGIGDGSGSGAGAGAGNGNGGGTRWARADWIEKPSPAEWARAWPANARRYEVRARVELGCVVPRPGPPSTCRVLNERPRGWGYGRAALELSRLPSFRIRPVVENDRDRGDIQVLVPVVFTPERDRPIR